MTTATRKPLRGRALWEKLVREQEAWVAECGGDLEGYLANYHDRHGRTVENATAIYNADVAALEAYRKRLAESAARSRRPVPRGDCPEG